MMVVGSEVHDDDGRLLATVTSTHVMIQKPGSGEGK
jgi:hypothetical protein